jgi:hypothetical protein
MQGWSSANYMTGWSSGNEEVYASTAPVYHHGLFGSTAYAYYPRYATYGYAGAYPRSSEPRYDDVYSPFSPASGYAPNYDWYGYNADRRRMQAYSYLGND